MNSTSAIKSSDEAEARKWYRDQAAEIKRVNTASLMKSKKNAQRINSTIDPKAIGSMFLFFYDPKTKDELPYWDTVPLVIPIEFYRDGFLGLNLHYLPPLLRAKMMDELYNTINNDKLDVTTKLRLNYSIVKRISKYYKPCVKRYLFNHVRSGFFYVLPNEWDMAIMLPLERFEGARKSTVFRNSVEETE